MTEDPKSDPPAVVNGLAEIRERAKQGRGLPPVHLWDPPFIGDIDMRIATDGTWFYQGTPITRPAMVKLFSTVLRRDGDDYFLVTPVERVGIKVDDAPFVAVELSVDGKDAQQTLYFRTNVDEIVTADAAHTLFVEIDGASQEPRPYLHVRRNLHALVNRSVFYELVELAVEEKVDGVPHLGVWSAGQFFPIAPAVELSEA